MKDKIELKDRKIDVKHINEANKLGLSTNEYIEFLLNLVNGYKSIELDNLEKRLERQEGLMATLIQSLESKNIAERSLVMTLEKDMKKVMVSNTQTQEFINSKLEFIDALYKVATKW